MLGLFRTVLVHLGEIDLAFFELVDLGVGYPFDVAVAHLGFQQALGITDTPQAQMAHIGFGCHKDHRHLVADLAAAQVGFNGEQIFIGRAETGRPLNSPDHDRSGVGTEIIPLVARNLGMFDMTDRMGMPVRAKALDLVKGQIGARGDHQIIIFHLAAAIEDDLVFLGQQLFRAITDEIDSPPFHHRIKIDNDVFLLAPANTGPGVGRGKLKIRLIGNNRYFIALCERFAQFIRLNGAAKTGPQYHDMGHYHPPR